MARAGRDGVVVTTPTDAVLMAAPLRIRNGTGSPLRVLAMIEKDTA